MRPKFIIFVLITVACAASALRMTAQRNGFAGRPQSVGLVLSGGGAKGIAHIGVIQALEDNNIPIDYISGTSMGAIVGSLYACGYTPEEMMTLIESKSFVNWSTGVIDPQLSYYFLQDDPLPTLLTLNFGDSDSTKWKPVLPSSLINPLPMNFAFMELYAPYTAQCGGDFNKLFVPFRCVSSDMTNKRMVVSGSGSLGDAVRASMSFPLVFHPIERNGALLYDGGIYDNFPVDVMRDSFAPQIMIGVDVATTDAADDNKSMVSQLETMIIQRSDYSLPADQGIKIRIHLEQFGLLDFNKARQIYKMGYDKAMEMMDSIRGRVTSRIAGDARRLRREVFKSQTPWLRFDSVSVEGGSEQQREYIESLFTRTTESDTFGLGHARDGFYRAITPGKFKNLEPEAVANDSSGLFTLNLRASMKNRVSVGIGGFLSTATNSMLFLSGAYKTLSFNSLDLRLNGWLGQSYLAAEVSGHIRLLRHQPSSLQINAVASRQKYFLNEKMFYQTSEPTALVTNEYFGRLSYGLALGRHGKGDISVGYGKVEHRSYPVEYPLTPDGIKISQNLAQARLAAERNTLNSQSVPTAGSRYRLSAIGVIGDISIQSMPTEPTAIATKDSHHRNWFQIEAQLEQYWSLTDKISLGAEIDLLYSSRKLLSSYAASLIDAPSFIASPSKSNIFSAEFRANSFGVAGFKPIWKLSSMFQVRATADVFVPLRPILPTGDGRARYGDYLSRAEFFGGLEGVLSLPFANVTAYANYATVGVSRWNFGLSFGLFIKAPGFLR